MHDTGRSVPLPTAHTSMAVAQIAAINHSGCSICPRQPAAPLPMTNAPAPPVPRRGSLLVIFLTVFIDLLGFGMVLPLLPVYARQFGVGEEGWIIGLLMASFSAMQFLFAPLWGRLSDRIGRRPVLIIGLAGSTFFYAMFG